MKNRYLFSLVLTFSIGMSACNNSDEPVSDETVSGVIVDTAKFLVDLANVEARIDNAVVPTDTDLKEAIVKFQDYAEIFPNDPKSPDYLLKASDFSLMTGDYRKSVRLLEQIIDKFPNYKRMEDVKYNRASHLDFELRDTTAAKIAYQNFIDEYPNSPLVGDCQARIPNIRYSAEQLIEKFTEDAANANKTQ